MKILQIISFFPPAYAYGGALKVAYGISKELVRRGHEVTVYTTDVYDATSRLKYDESPTYVNGIRVYRFKNISDKLARYNFALAPTMFVALKGGAKNFDIIHLHEYRSFQAIFTHHQAKKHGIPYILQAHGSVPRIMAKRGLKQVYDNLWGYKLLRDASKTIALTKTEVEQYKIMGVSEDKIELIPNGIDLSEFKNLPQRGEFRRKYGLNDDQKIILYLGRIHKIKGLDVLAKAFADLSKELNNVKLVIAGPDDGYLPALKQLIKELQIGEKVLFSEPLYGEEKLEAYVDADIYVLPSIYETFPVGVLESCACGLPIVVTNRCGIADIIDGQAGLVVPSDKDQLSNAISRILSDDKIRQQFGEEGKLLVREKFNWPKIVEQVEAIYRATLTKAT